MNRIRKAAAAVVALTITLAGSVSVIAPLALTNVHTFAPLAVRSR